mgnify:CR=1 FL=1
MNHSWNHDPFQGGGPVPHRPKKQRRPIGTPVGRTLLNLAVTLVFGAIYFYVTLPPLNLHSGDFYVFALLLCAVYCGCAVLTSGFQGSGAKGYFGFVKKQCTVPFVLGLVLVVTALMPVLGVPLFWYTKSDVGHNALKRRLLDLEGQTRAQLPQNEQTVELLQEQAPEAMPLARYLRGKGGGFRSMPTRWPPTSTAAKPCSMKCCASWKRQKNISLWSISSSTRA